jgi:CRISPR system Cascade subunit CasA
MPQAVFIMQKVGGVLRNKIGRFLMNLINDAWIPVIRADGQRGKIAPWQIAEVENPVIDVVAPRVDLQGALYQFMIGLLQTAFAPADSDEWFEYKDSPPNVDFLKMAFLKFETAFSITFSDSFAFMQDLEDFEGEDLPIEDLIGGELSDNTRKNNTDLFLKTKTIKVVSPYWAALSLFNVQTSGVLAWGKHRVGMRGNGPVNLLAVYSEEKSFWQNIWLNILDKEDGCLLPGDWSLAGFSNIFPWLGNTRKSADKEKTIPSDCNPLQHFWPMPRRIRLCVNRQNSICDISGDEIEYGVSTYKRTPNGALYSGGWQNPISPYFINKDKSILPRVVTGNNISYGYRDYVSWVFGRTSEDGVLSGSYAVTNSVFNRRIDGVRVWCFGYRAENANVYGYINKFYPVFNCDLESRELLSSWLHLLVEAVDQLIDEVVKGISEARWGTDKNEKERNKRAVSSFKKSNDVADIFWGDTEVMFYSMVERCFSVVSDNRFMPADVAKDWLSILSVKASDVFDEFVLQSGDVTIRAKRIFTARLAMKKSIEKNKVLQTLEQQAKATEEVA